ncbi:MAG: hypothetical protein ACMUHB_06605 [Thermoplasmatota archaeon]
MGPSISGCFEDAVDDIDGNDNVDPPPYPTDTRYDRLPGDIIKRTPEGDKTPPLLHSNLFEEPVPMDGPINTPGAEDSPFILPDGGTFYFFFTPDVRIPPERQILDNVTGIWSSELTGGGWTEPKRVWLQEPGKLALDGAHWVDPDDTEIWFASAREGYTGLHYFIAQKSNGRFENWHYADSDLNDIYQMGEMHRVEDTIYFHSPRNGGKGGNDIWTTTFVNGSWQPPVNLDVINTGEHESLPWVSESDDEMFFTRTHMGTPGIFRSTKMNGTWNEPELILSQFAGEPTLDGEGNLYFVHHFFEEGEMIEADIYYCQRK